MRALLLCLLLPACLDEEPPDPTTEYQAIYTVESPAIFDTLAMVLPDTRTSLTVDPPNIEYVWDYTVWNWPDFPASIQVIAYRDGAVVAYADQVFTYDDSQTPSGSFTIELHP